MGRRGPSARPPSRGEDDNYHIRKVFAEGIYVLGDDAAGHQRVINRTTLLVWFGEIEYPPPTQCWKRLRGKTHGSGGVVQDRLADTEREAAMRAYVQLVQRGSQFSLAVSAQNLEIAARAGSHAYQQLELESQASDKTKIACLQSTIRNLLLAQPGIGEAGRG